MALIVDISPVEEQDALSFDTTDNTIYGGSNPAVGAILTATLLVTLPNSTVPFSIPISLPVFVLMATVPLNTTAASLGLSILPDGIYTVSLVLTYAAAPTTSTGTVTVGFIAIVRCGVNKMLAAVSVDDTCSCCDNSPAMKALEAYVDLCIATSAIQFGLTNVFNKFLIRLQKIVGLTNCGCP